MNHYSPLRELEIQHDMVGNSPRLQQLLDFIAKAAPTDCTVLITGETGTGKELVARALHRNSRRSAGPFVALNCAAMPEGLLESEWFGHERGSFTGAIRDRIGKFEHATGGTLFLDEIGDMPLGFQPKLLRVIQERAIERIGGVRQIAVDIRLIAATNRDLPSAIAAGEFREDLLHRLGVSVHVPALRDRPEDIPLLARHFLAKSSRETGRVVNGISEETLGLFQVYDWPGNVRELQNLIVYGIVFGSSELLLPGDLPDRFFETVRCAQQTGQTYRDLTRDLKRNAFETALKRAFGDYKRAAALLRVPANGMHRLVKQLGLSHLLNRRAQEHES